MFLAKDISKVFSMFAESMKITTTTSRIAHHAGERENQDWSCSRTFPEMMLRFVSWRKVFRLLKTALHEHEKQECVLACNIYRLSANCKAAEMAVSKVQDFLTTLYRA